MDTYKDEEFDKRKVLAPLVALLIAVLCIAGVGVAYAYTALTSTQTIGENTTDDQYILLTSDVGSDMAVDVLDKVAFNSVRDSVTEDFFFTVAGTESVPVNGTPINNAMRISVDGWTVKVDKHIEGNDADTFANTYDLVVTATDFTPVDGFTYILKVGDTAKVFSAGWSFDNLAYETTYNVALYMQGTSANATATPVSGFVDYDDSDAEHVVNGTVFTFTATADEVVTP